MYIIYKIQSRFSNTCYIGLTKDFETRKKQHQKNKNPYYCTSVKVFKEDSNPVFTILEIHSNYNTAQFRESILIKNTPNTVNKIINNHSQNEYYLQNRDKYLQWQKQRLICDCGKCFTRRNKLKHYNTNAHKKLTENPFIYTDF